MAEMKATARQQLLMMRLGEGARARASFVLHAMFTACSHPRAVAASLSRKTPLASSGLVGCHRLAQHAWRSLAALRYSCRWASVVLDSCS